MTSMELSVYLTSVIRFLDYNFLYLVSLYSFPSCLFFSPLLYHYFISFLSFLFPTNFFSSTNKRFHSEQIFRMPLSLHLVLQVQGVCVCVCGVSVCFRSFYCKKI